MDDSRPEWDNQPTRCFVCMTERDNEGKCKCPPPPSMQEMFEQLTSVDVDKEDRR